MMLCLELWTEKKYALGEDAPPTSEIGDDQTCLMAVYDGLGGAGGTRYVLPSMSETASGAYLASRYAKTVTESFFKDWDKTLDFAKGLEDTLRARLLAYREELALPASRLRSRLIKTLPTTIAGILIEEKTDKNSIPSLEATTFWAGDSRCYFLLPDGLRQVSYDDLQGNPDALQNLRLDAPITNCLHAEGDFRINSITHLVDIPILFLVATDGCFGYVPTPMHFEYILLDTLMQSDCDMEDWEERLRKTLLSLTGDDMSLVLMAWGFQDLESIKSYLRPRYDFLQNAYIKVWQDSPTPTEESIQDLWAQYRSLYYQYAHQAGISPTEPR